MRDIFLELLPTEADEAQGIWSCAIERAEWLSELLRLQSVSRHHSNLSCNRAFKSLLKHPDNNIDLLHVRSAALIRPLSFAALCVDRDEVGCRLIRLAVSDK